ncbi:MAG TPA: RidA family protein [Thermopetrobacter sp.]|nr:RidA family protein [Thermopetrobacter sp.]
MSTIAERLRKLGIALPAAPDPVANYVGRVQAGSLLFVSGQLPLKDGELVCTGQAGGAVSVETARDAARRCAINCIAQAAAHLNGELERVARVVKLTGFVNAAPGFADHPAIINGASDLMVAVFGDAGRHARAAVGVSSLPLDATVELEAVFEIRQ